MRRLLLVLAFAGCSREPAAGYRDAAAPAPPPAIDAAIAVDAAPTPGDVYVPGFRPTARGDAWRDDVVVTMALELAVAGLDNTAMTIHTERRRTVIDAVENGRVTRATVTYVSIQEDTTVNDKKTTVKAPYAGKTYQLALEDGAVVIRNRNGGKPPPDELAALTSRERRFGKSDPYSTATRGLRFPKGVPVDLPPEPFNGFAFDEDSIAEQAQMTYLGMDGDLARCQVKVDMLSEASSKTVEIDFSGLVWFDADGRRRKSELTGKIQVEGMATGHGALTMKNTVTLEK